MLKILLLDIETAPLRSFTWGLWKQNVGLNQIENDWFMLTWSAKWYGKNEKTVGMRLKKEEAIEQDDSRILEKLWKLMDEADVVIGHNGDKFDIPKINTRFIKNGFMPPSPYRTVDTLKIAKRHFRFTSNKLDYLGDFLGVGRKIDTGGFELWERCYKGENKALKEMLDYNLQDVLLLEDVYDKLKPYCSIHPSHAVTSDEECCPKCGSTHVHKRGLVHTNVSTFQRFRCMDCGSWSRGRSNIRSKEAMKNTLAPVSF